MPRGRLRRDPRPIHQAPPPGQLSGIATSAKAARLLESELRERAGDTRDRGSGDTTLARLIEQWWAAGPALAPTTRKNYRENIDRHILPALGDRKLKAIRPLLVAEFLHHLSSDKDLPPGRSARSARCSPR
ncbi:MAG: N-terminal phage integrase SAM-like domain-containing protein [Acidimicrobiales bacterium]